MKKTLLLALIACAMVPRAHAQTDQETADWLNAKLKADMFYAPAASDTLINNYILITHTILFYNGDQFKGFADKATVIFHDLTNVSTKSGFEETVNRSQVPVIKIVLTGSVESCVQSSPARTEASCSSL